ncbi:MAG: hypothetical protein FWG63_04850 [Defluviitaleaceae bacterium]|nr:hypothetical protein [Defluviitaleaceae bacterium]
MVTTSSMMEEILELKIKIVLACENPVVKSAKSLEDVQDMLEYVLQYKNDLDKSHKVFASLARTLYTEFFKIANYSSADGEKIEEIRGIIENLDFFAKLPLSADGGAVNNNQVLLGTMGEMSKKKANLC